MKSAIATLAVIACIVAGLFWWNPNWMPIGNNSEKTKPAKIGVAPGEQVRAIIKKFEDDWQSIIAKAKATKDEDEQQKLYLELPNREEIAKQLWSIVQSNPKDDKMADAMIWIATHCNFDRKQTDTPAAKSRTALMTENANHPKIGEFCRGLSQDTFDAAAVNFVRKVVETNKNVEAKGQAMLALSKLLRDRSSIAERVRNLKDEKEMAGFVKFYGQEAAVEVRKVDPLSAKVEGETLLDQLATNKELGAVEISRGEEKITLAELASRELFKIRNLAAGKPAPEIIGEDIDGQQMKLSDFKGKVVLLDFWGHW